MSSLRVNFIKIKLYGVNLNSYFILSAFQYLNCCIDSLLFKFLGVVVGVSPRRGSLIMSRGGYIHGKVGDYRWVVGFFLIISVLNGTTSFMLSFYKIPMKVKRQLTQIQSNFLWGGVSQKRSIHWVSYDKKKS